MPPVVVPRRRSPDRTAHADLATLTRALLGVLAAGAVGAGCITSGSPTPELLEPVRAADAFRDPDCSAQRRPTEPDLMGWDSGSRAKLKQLHEQGLVGVRYRVDGCAVELEVLDCVVPREPFRFSAYSASETKIASSASELYGQLPIGAARLAAQVEGGRSLRTDYLLAGVRATDVLGSVQPERLTGDCSRATHVVSRVYLGAFAMASGQREALGAEASLLGLGAGGSVRRSVETLAREGERDACERAQRTAAEDPACAVPLRVGLTPIAGRTESTCPVGSTWEGDACVTGGNAAAASVSAEPPPAAAAPSPSAATPAVAAPSATSASPPTAALPPASAVTAPGPVVAPAPAPRVAIPAVRRRVRAPSSGRLDAGSCPGGMVPIDGGTYVLTGDDQRAQVGGFCMDRTEVTADAYARCVDGGTCPPAGTGAGCNVGRPGRGDHPANCVSWQGASRYCAAQGKRLPTEEEWEWAARGGGAGRLHPWGAPTGGVRGCWGRRDGGPAGQPFPDDAGTCPVGAFPAARSLHDLDDLDGNVREWTATAADATRSEWVTRGWFWMLPGPPAPIGAGVSRSSQSADTRDFGVGFRCAR